MDGTAKGGTQSVSEQEEKEEKHETLNMAERETLILQLAPNERFEGFADFKKFDDIGFFPGRMNIESCSHFLYLTHITHDAQPEDTNAKSHLDKEDKEHPDKRKKQVTSRPKLSNRLNLLLIDKFHEKEDIQFAVFKSCTYFDNDFIKANDFVAKAVIQSSMSRKNEKYNTYLWQ